MSLWSRIERRLSGIAGELLSDEFRQALDEARAKLAKGQAAAAIERLEDLIQARPDHIGAICLLGFARLELGDPEGARDAFEHALTLRDDDPEALLGVGQAALNLGQSDAAIDGFRSAVRSSDGDRDILALAYRGLGQAYRRRGELDKAVRELRKAVAEHSSDLLARAALGEALLTDPQLSAEEARQHLDQVIQPAGDDGRETQLARVIASNALGRIALDDGEPDLARHHFERAADILTEPPPAPAPAQPQAAQPTDAAPDSAAPDQPQAAQHADAAPDSAAPGQPQAAQHADAAPDSSAADPQSTDADAQSTNADAQSTNADPQSTDAQSTNTDAQSADAQPTDAQPADAQSTDSQPADAQSTDADPQSADAQHADAQHADAQHADAQPTDADPAHADEPAAATGSRPAPAADTRPESWRTSADWAGHLCQTRLGLGQAALLMDDPDLAHRHFGAALALAPRDPTVHARIGDAERHLGRTDAALSSYQRSLALHADPGVLARALDLAIETRAVDDAVRLANDMLAIDPGDPRAAVAQGLGMAARGQHDAARAVFRAARDAGGALDAHLALGRLELDIARDREHARAAGDAAATEALAALRLAPTDPRARALLDEARQRELGLASEQPSAPSATTGAAAPDAAAGLYRLAGKLQTLALARSELTALAGPAAAAAADFDQPLLVTVMGEFSSGKSTFVNAFIGHDVAPTGITPTTATINIVKYGREPGGRVLYRDGTTDALSWGDLFGALHALDAEQVRNIDVVEILYPLAQLERVNIVDTPGLNSILPEHEEVARGFIGRADAVIWVFTAGQAGKASEREALAGIREQGKRVLGVLNKMDQLAPKEIDELVNYVQGELGDLVEIVVPVSARAALERRDASAAAASTATSTNSNAGTTTAATPATEPPPAAAEPAAPKSTGASDEASAEAGAEESDDSNWPALDSALDSRFFAQARELKRDALSRRLDHLIRRAQAIVVPHREHAEAAAARLRAEADALASAGIEFIDRVVLLQRSALQDTSTELYRQAAREVLDLVRPRQLPFGSHSATPADREYLISLLDSGYEAALERSRFAVVRALEGHKARTTAAISAATPILGGDAASDIARTAEDALRLVEAQVFGPARAYLRGYVRGGYVRDFFERTLPKLELAEDTVYNALVQGAPNLDAEIALRLATAGTAAIGAMADRLEHWAAVADVLAYDVTIGVERALAELARRRQQWSEGDAQG